MADAKISALPAAATPLTGTEVIPVVQGGATDKVSVDNLTAGRDVDVKKLTATDNVVVGTAGKGIDFSANGGDVLTQYDEGTWNVVWTNLTGTPTNLVGHYTRIGRMVTFTYATGAGAISGTSGSVRFTLPFTPAQQAVGASLAEGPGTPVLNWIYTDGNCYPIGFGAAYMVFSGTYFI